MVVILLGVGWHLAADWSVPALSWPLIGQCSPLQASHWSMTGREEQLPGIPWSLATPGPLVSTSAWLMPTRSRKMNRKYWFHLRVMYWPDSTFKNSIIKDMNEYNLITRTMREGTGINDKNLHVLFLNTFRMTGYSNSFSYPKLRFNYLFFLLVWVIPVFANITDNTGVLSLFTAPG